MNEREDGNELKGKMAMNEREDGNELRVHDEGIWV